MTKVDQEVPQKDKPAETPDHAAKIRAQVLEKVGRPPGMHQLEVCQHHNGNYRVNLWEKSEPVGDFALSARLYIRSSYYLKVSDTGEILTSNPPLTKLAASS